VAVDSSAARIAVALLSCALVAMPFVFVRFPPITDLPQHVAQIRLFGEALTDPSTIYTIQWFTPYSLCYAVLAFFWALVPPAEVGRCAMLFLAVAWAGAVHAIAARRGRSATRAMLASLLTFNLALYWGFLSFVFGWVVFAFWLDVTSRASADRFGWRDAGGHLAAALLLYFTHVLWLACGLAWLAAMAVRRRLPMRAMALRAASVTPVVLATALWYPHLARSGFVSETMWATPIYSRISFNWLVDGTLGGLRGAAEPVALGFILAWLALSAWQHREQLATVVDGELALLGGFLLAGALVLPDKQMNTIYFAVRWLAPAMVALLLALPPPRLPHSIARIATVGLLAVFSATTAVGWTRFERFELSGLGEALAGLPETPRVLGLDFVKESTVLKGRPFLQTFAYAQVVQGGRLNFSFAGFAPSLVVYRGRLGVPWTIGLEWFPETVRAEDFRHFDVALINASDAAHRLLAERAPIAPVTKSGRWRLYRTLGDSR
jgi:hypothetical protein